MSGKPAARQGDMTRKGLDIVQGSAGVLIGAPTGVACSVCPKKRTVQIMFVARYTCGLRRTSSGSTCQSALSGCELCCAATPPRASQSDSLRL